MVTALVVVPAFTRTTDSDPAEGVTDATVTPEPAVNAVIGWTWQIEAAVTAEFVMTTVWLVPVAATVMPPVHAWGAGPECSGGGQAAASYCGFSATAGMLRR